MGTINDANGTPAKVNSSGRLKVYSVVEPEELHICEDYGRAFSISIDCTTGTADDDFFYLKNNDDDDLIITKIEGWCAANQEIQVVLGATGPGQFASGDDIAPVAANVGSGQVADVDCASDETDLAIPGGSVYRLLKFSPTALTREDFHFPEGIILPKNTRLHLQAAGASLINLNMFFYFHD